MRNTTVVIRSLLIFIFTTINASKVPNMRMGSLVRYYNYPYENHTVLTDDGYFITIGRIPYQNTKKCPRSQGTAVLWHGIFQNGEAYLCQGPDQSLGFLLSNECYDVWLPNARGSKYSQKHINYTTSQRKFWDTTIDEMAFFEVTAVADYITNKTGGPFHGIGTSMGTTMILMTLARLPDYKRNFLSLQLLAPFAFPSNTDPGLLWDWIPLNLAREFLTTVPELTSFPSDPHRGFFRQFLTELCVVPSDTCGIISDISKNVHAERAGVWRDIDRFFPDAVSVKIEAHFAQIIIHRKLTMYDYGPEKNLELYGNETAPTYNLENITTPTYLYHAGNDDHVQPADAIMLEKAMPNVISRHFVQEPEFTHLDFTMTSFNLKELVNVHVLSAIKSQSKTQIRVGYHPRGLL